MKNKEEIFRQLKKCWWKKRNGLAVELMEKSGVNYPKNYGLTLAEIQESIKSLPKNNPLARFLFQQGLREAKLSALFIFQANNLSTEEHQNICKKLNTNELIEQAARILYAEYKDLENLILKLFDAQDHSLHQVAIQLLTPYFKKCAGQMNCNDKIIDHLIFHARKINNQSVQSISFAFRLLMKNLETKSKIRDLQKELAKSEDYASRLLAEELYTAL